MAVWEPIVTQVLLDGFLHRPQTGAVKKKAAWWLVATAALLAAVGAVYMIMGLHLYLLTVYLPMQAALATGGAVLIASVLCLVTFFILEDARKMKMKAQAALHGNHHNEILGLVNELTKGLEDPIANNPRTSVILASLAGYLSGNKIH